MTSKHLKLMDGHAIVGEPRERFVTQVVPVQVDLGERFSVGRPLAARFARPFDAVWQE